MKKAVSCFLLLCFLFSGTSCANQKTKIKVLILPKFEIGEMTSDTAGEAQYYYEEYFKDAKMYGIAGDSLYVKDGMALYITKMGKSNGAASTTAVLTDPRFDFSDAYILSVGVSGSSINNTVMGDVFVITSVVDYDLGHHADVREMANPTDATWFYNAEFDDAGYVLLNQDLTEEVYELVKDVPLGTTEKTKQYMYDAFDGEAWAIRDPAVLKGTSVTGDDYWKGKYGHANALLVTETYGCPDPYVTTEMEEISVAVAAKRLGLVDHLIILRASVNMDVFVFGDTPESIWEDAYSVAEFRNNRKADIFDTSLKNNFACGRRIIDAILAGKLQH